MNPSTLREDIRRFLNLERIETAIDYEVLETVPDTGFTRQRIIYKAADGDEIPAFLLSPDGDGPFPAVLVHHQHASQRYLGKSEIMGIAGDPLQAFGPELAKRGFMILAPDSICFEDRRRNATGIEPHEHDDIQHYIEMGNRLTQGDTLMRKVLSDASTALSLLAHHPQMDTTKIGALGHSYGGNTVLFQAALEPRIRFAVSSGALCSYAYKREHNIALELALVIPGFAARWDLYHLLDCIAPRPLFVVSAENDRYAKDATEVIARAVSNEHITHFRDDGEHALTPERFNRILDFLSDCVG